MADLNGKRIAFLATDMVEQVELTEPWKAVEEGGATAELVSLDDGEIQGFNHYDKADRFPVDRTVEEATPDDYDALVLPGGVGNPDTLRMDENAVGFVRAPAASATLTRCEWTRTPSGSSAGSSRAASRSQSSATGRGRSWRRTSSGVAR